jgi:hypothetical protein
MIDFLILKSYKLYKNNEGDIFRGRANPECNHLTFPLSKQKLLNDLTTAIKKISKLENQ